MHWPTSEPGSTYGTESGLSYSRLNHGHHVGAWQAALLDPRSIKASNELLCPILSLPIQHRASINSVVPLYGYGAMSAGPELGKGY